METISNKKSEMNPLPAGVYRHYKGNDYLVLGIARHCETEELFVVYVRLYSRPGIPISIRPLSDFLGTVIDPSGNTVKRFEYIGSQQ